LQVWFFLFFDSFSTNNSTFRFFFELTSFFNPFFFQGITINKEGAEYLAAALKVNKSLQTLTITSKEYFIFPFFVVVEGDSNKQNHSFPFHPSCPERQVDGITLIEEAATLNGHVKIKWR
jgi:hypothetical protein